MSFELPPNWVADHDQAEAELRELVRPILAALLVVRADADEAVDEGVRLATSLAEHLSPLPREHVLELLLLALTKIANHALERYDERMAEFYEEHLRAHHDGGRDGDGAAERGGSDPERAAEEAEASAPPKFFDR